MSGSLNKVILIGRLGKDPETRYGGNGNAVTKISMATSEKWKDAKTGERKEETEWHHVVFFGKVAEIAAEYLVKGSECCIEGKLKTSSYEKDGVKRYTTEVIADKLTMLGGSSVKPQAAAQQRAQESVQADPFGDDDIPF